MTRTPWHLVRPPADVLGIDGETYQVVRVDTGVLPHVVYALDRSGTPVVRTVDPWGVADVLDEASAIVALARHFNIEGVQRL